jgi:putative selenate reductase FAD-binding subunit
MNIQAVHRPKSLDEAWELLERGGKAARLLGGGVDLAWLSPAGVEMLIDLSLVGPRGIATENGELHIGAGTTLTEILEWGGTTYALQGLLRTVLRRVASPLQRNLATLGGAIAGAHPWSDVISLMLALDARVIRYAGESDVRPIEELLASRGRRDRAILTEVILPAAATGSDAAFAKFSRTGFDIGLLNCICRVTVTGETCSDVRVVMGGTPSIAQRLGAVEGFLDGQPLCNDRIEGAARMASKEIPARDDLRASATYRRELARVGVRRCLATIQHRMEGRA